MQHLAHTPLFYNADPPGELAAARGLESAPSAPMHKPSAQLIACSRRVTLCTAVQGAVAGAPEERGRPGGG